MPMPMLSSKVPWRTAGPVVVVVVTVVAMMMVVAVVVVDVAMVVVAMDVAWQEPWDWDGCSQEEAPPAVPNSHWYGCGNGLAKVERAM